MSNLNYFSLFLGLNFTHCVPPQYISHLFAKMTLIILE